MHAFCTHCGHNFRGSPNAVYICAFTNESASPLPSRTHSSTRRRRKAAPTARSNIGGPGEALTLDCSSGQIGLGEWAIGQVQSDGSLRRSPASLRAARRQDRLHHTSQTHRPERRGRRKPALAQNQPARTRSPSQLIRGTADLRPTASSISRTRTSVSGPCLRRARGKGVRRPMTANTRPRRHAHSP